MKPQVSVTIPNHNGAKWLREAIDSALTQQEVRVEVIVVDDGSTDHSREIIESYSDKIRSFYQENKGAPAARNLGWREATADVIKFLDSDDVLLPGVLKMQWDQMAGLKENEIPYGDAIWTDEALNPVNGYPVKPISPGQDPVHHILTQNPLTSSPLHRKSLLTKVNGFDESLVKGQEFDLHLRLVLAGVIFCHYDYSIYCFRQGSHSGKISNLSIVRFHREIFAGLQNQETLIRNHFGNQFPIQIKKVLSERYLNYGKACLLGNELIGSLKYITSTLRLKFGN